ncbi:MAG: CoB--CoM heterodisulfide reductase iron-sulfur subunit B family protein [Candidatus Thalassarchaeaceae archaeon]|jgi:succinate dehydrogenase / fumarate reductase cytochrome b subunit|nr:CoB--CoM heterodisulfide reductase iron-sulfur subunit B family protein [Candidatus Thalassarchaeaceae archaeon]
MAMKYAYHPGNVAHSNALEVADTMPFAAESLGIELIPLDAATSCGAGILRQANEELQITLNARTLAIAESMGLDIITSCATTAGTLHEDLNNLRNDKQLLSKVNDILQRHCGLTLKCEINVHHLLHVIVDEIGLEKLADAVKNPFGFKIAGYYGPNIQQDGACGGDDIFDPDYLEQVISVLGGEPVQWSSKTQSVGVPGLFSEDKTVMKQTASVLSDAKSEGAQLVVSACNLSHMLLDVYQGKAGKVSGKKTKVPVIHLTEFLAFAFGHYIDRCAQLRTRVLVIGD